VHVKLNATTMLTDKAYNAKHKVNRTSKNGEVKDVQQSTYTSRKSFSKIQSQVMRGYSASQSARPRYQPCTTKDVV